MLGFRNYNYERFSREHLHEFVNARFSGPKAGDPAPDFSVVDSALKPVTIRGVKRTFCWSSAP